MRFRSFIKNKCATPPSTAKYHSCTFSLPSRKATSFFSVVSVIYAIIAKERVGRKPESPASAEPINITYSGHSKYMTMSMTTLPRNAPMAGARSAGFLRRDLSVQGPQNGATMSAGMVEKNVFPVMILVAKLCTWGMEVLKENQMLIWDAPFLHYL